MVSSIDDVSFGDNKGKGVLVDSNNKVNNVPTNPNYSTLEAKPLDSEKVKEGSAIMNGVQSAEESSSDKKSEGTSNKVQSMQMSPQETNGHYSCKTPPLPPMAPSGKPLTNGFSKEEKESENQIIITPSQSVAFDGVPKLKSSNGKEATLIAVKRKRKLSEEMKPPILAAKKGKIPQPSCTSHVPAPSPKTNITDSGERSATVEEVSSVPHIRNPVTTKSGSIPKPRLAPMKLDAVSSLQVFLPLLIECRYMHYG